MYRIRNICILTLSLFLGVFLFSPLLFDAQKFYVYLDTVVALIPLKKLWLSSVLQGELPVWNSYIHAGTPYWADFKSSVLNPFNLTLLFFSPDQILRAVVWQSVWHYPLLYLAMFYFLRQQRLSLQACALFAFLYSASGVAVSSFGMLGLLEAAIFIPLLFLVGQRFSKARLASSNTVLAALCFAAPVYCVLPEFAFYFAFLFLLQQFVFFATARARARARALHLLGKFLFICLLAIGLASPVLLPGLEHFYLENIQPEYIQRSTAIKYALSPARLAELFLLHPFGNFSTDNVYWGKVFFDLKRLPILFHLYVGSFSVLSILLIVLFFSKKTLAPVLFAVMVLLFSATEYLPFIGKALFQVASLAGFFRSTEKWFIFFPFFFFWASAISWNKLFFCFRAGAERPLYFIYISWFSFSCVAFLAVNIFLNINTKQIDLQVWYFYFGLGVSHLVLLYLLFRSALLFKFRWIVLLLVFGIELVAVGQQNLFTQDVNLVASEAAEKIKADLRDRQLEIAQGAAFRSTSAITNGLQILLPHNQAKGLSLLGRGAKHAVEGLSPSTNILFGISSLYGLGTVQSEKRNYFLIKSLNKSLKKTFDLFSVFYEVVSDEESIVRILVKKNTSALPYIFSPKEVLFYSSEKKAIDAVLDSEFDMHNQAIVQKGESGSYRGSGKLKVAGVFRKNGKIRFQVTEGKAGEYLLLNESYNRHWIAFQGKEPLSVFPANGYAMAVRLKKDCRADNTENTENAREGECMVTFAYQNIFISIGLIIGILTFLFCIFLWLFANRLTRNKQHELYSV